jgi:Leucine-rich repeat (LRR) protein
MKQITDWIISMEANLTSLYVDSMDNAVLCKRMFNGFYKFDSLNIEAKNVEEIEADFLHGQQIYKCLRIVNGRIKRIKQNTFKNLMVAVVSLHENEIQQSKEKLSRTCRALEEISLVQNKITRLSPDSFVKLPRLTLFGANNNRISKIQKEFF